MTLTSNPQSHFHPLFLSAAQRFKMTSTAEWVEADEAALMATTFNNLTHLNIKIAFASSGHPPMSCVLAQACYGKVTTWPLSHCFIKMKRPSPSQPTKQLPAKQNTHSVLPALPRHAHTNI